MRQRGLERGVRTSASLIAGGVLLELLSFGWAHPLAFLLFGVVGGGLAAAGVVWFVVVGVRGRAWADRVEPGE